MKQLFVSALVSFVCLCACGLGADERGPAHVLSLAKVDGKEGFVLSTIPAADAKDQSIKTRTLCSERDLSIFRVCGVYGGHIIALKQPFEFLAFDTTTGAKKQLSRAACENAILTNGHLYYVVATGKSATDQEPTHALQMMDLKTGAQQELCLLTSSGAGMSHFGKDFTFAATSDGSKIAVTEMVTDSNLQSLCRIVVVDCRTKEVTRSQLSFPSRSVLTGAGHWLLAPKLFWLDDSTLLVAAANGSSQLGGIVDTQKLYSYQTSTQSIEEICNLPKFIGQVFDPGFSFGNDGKTLIHLGSLGAFEILLEDKKLRESNESIGGFVFKQAKGRVSIHEGENVLASGIERSRVFVSFDGGQIAWLPEAARNGMVLQEPMDLKAHDRLRGTRTILTQQFKYLNPTPQSPNTTVCMWLTDADLNRTKVFEQFDDYVSPFAGPSIDSRPAINESVELSLKTDKASYLQHEPVSLTISVKNLASAPIQLESGWLKQSSQPFHDLFIVTQDSKTEIQFSEQYAGDLTSEFVTIEPGKSRDFQLTIESGSLGKHAFQMRFEHFSFWKGELKAEAQFQIVKGGNEAELLRQKFDRLLSKSIAKYKSQPSGHVNRNHFEQLGVAALPLLVEHLHKCEDGAFRRFIGYGLPRIADSSTLPLLRQLLKSDLEFDGNTVVETLWEIYYRGDFASRPIPETILLLIEAGKHPNVEVRRKIAATLRHSVNKAVDDFMQQASEDSDAEVASIAGRYVAARQHLPLQRWLFDASLKMTPAGLVAARSIVRELEQLSQEEHGKIPSGKFEEVIADPATVAEYTATLKAWIVYCITHQRSVETFFDKDREQNTLWQGFVTDRYASGENQPIKLDPRITHTIQD